MIWMPPWKVVALVVVGWANGRLWLNVFRRRKEDMTFGEAIEALKSDRRVSRQGWNGKGQFLGLQLPDSMSQNTLPYIWIRTAQGQRVPWLASQTDMLAEDWVELP